MVPVPIALPPLPRPRPRPPALERGDRPPARPRVSWDPDALDDAGALARRPPLHPDDNAPAAFARAARGHRGRVVKGVGRTALAANWNRADEASTATAGSRLLPLRERFITEALRRDGGASSPLQGLRLPRRARERERLAAAAHASDWRLARSTAPPSLPPAPPRRPRAHLQRALGLHHHGPRPRTSGDLLLRLVAYTRAGGPIGDPPEAAGSPRRSPTPSWAPPSARCSPPWGGRGCVAELPRQLHARRTLRRPSRPGVPRRAVRVGFVRSAETGTLHLVGFRAMTSRSSGGSSRAPSRRGCGTVADGPRPRGGRAALPPRGVVRRARAGAGSFAFDPTRSPHAWCASWQRRSARRGAKRAVLAALGQTMAGAVFARRRWISRRGWARRWRSAQPAQPTVTGRAEYLAARGLGRTPALTETGAVVPRRGGVGGGARRPRRGARKRPGARAREPVTRERRATRRDDGDATRSRPRRARPRAKAP